MFVELIVDVIDLKLLWMMGFLCLVVVMVVVCYGCFLLDEVVCECVYCVGLIYGIGWVVVLNDVWNLLMWLFVSVWEKV